MHIDRDKALQYGFEPVPFDIERGRLRFFARTLGLEDPIYSDLAAARSAGYPDLPAPPTFLGHSLELELPSPMGWLVDIGGDLRKTTHAEQSFSFHRMAFAGDHIVMRRRIIDVYLKKHGALEFVVKQTLVTRGDDLLSEVLSVIALRHPEVRS